MVLFFFSEDHFFVLNPDELPLYTTSRLNSTSKKRIFLTPVTYNFFRHHPVQFIFFYKIFAKDAKTTEAVRGHFYGSLYVTLCFVLCPFDFGVLTIYFCMLSSLFVYNVAHFKRRNSRGRAKMENKRGKKDESISILIHPF